MAASDGVLVTEIEEGDRLKELLNHTDILKEVECYSKDAEYSGSGEASGLF
jgi:hypothetical protein